MVVPNVTLRQPNPQPLAPAAQPVPQQTRPPLSAYSDAELLADFRRLGLVPGLPEGCTQTVPTVPTPVLVTHPSTIGLTPMLASTSSQQMGELCNTTAPSCVPENISVPNQSSLSHTWVPNSQNPSISREQNLGRNYSTVANPDCLEFPAQTDSALPKLPKFQHTYDGTTDWSVFIRLFELAARLSRWSEADTCIILLQSLTGKAASILITLPEHLTIGVNYEPLKARLTAIFAATATPAQSRLQLNVRRQRPN